MRPASTALAAAIALACAAAIAQVPEPGAVLEIRIEPAAIETDVGATANVRIHATNTGAAPVPAIALHIDVTDPLSRTSVDPEDWTPELTYRVGPIAAGATVSQGWELVPVKGGEYVLYAVAIDTRAGARSGPIAISPGVPVTVIERRGFNPEGVTPVVVGVPVLLAIALAWRARRQRRRGTG